MMMCFPGKTLVMDPTSQRIIPFRKDKHGGSPQSQFDDGDTMSNMCMYCMYVCVCTIQYNTNG